MSKHTLSETERLLQGVEPVEGEEYSLESILAEFGSGAAEPAPDEPVCAVPEEEAPAGEAPVCEAEEPEAEAPAQVPAPAGEAQPADLRSTIADAVDQAMAEGPAARSDDEDTKDLSGLRQEIRAAENGETPEESETPAEELPDEPEQEPSEEEPEQASEDEPEQASEDEPEQVPPEEESEPTEEADEPDHPAGYPGEPEGADHRLSLEQVMSQTVEAVLEEGDAILEPRASLKERLAEWKGSLQNKKDAVIKRVSGRKHKDIAPQEDAGEEADQPKREAEMEPEPDMEQVAAESKQLCQKWRKSVLYMALPTAALVILAVLDELRVLPKVWQDTALLHCGVPGVLLAAAMALAIPVWHKIAEDFQERRFGCEQAAGLSAIVTLADCLLGAVLGQGNNLPLAAPAAVMLWLCLCGMLQQANARREAFRLADLGGVPPYAVTVTAAGACKQKGRLEGFYHLCQREDPSRHWQRLMIPLLLAASTVLALVVCLIDRKMSQFLWIWSALLTASLPLSLPLTGALPLSWLNKRLVKSGSAVAGYYGARMVSRSKRMVVSDDDLFPPGTVGLNGLKIFGEEIGKVVSYAATVTKAADSQLSPLFEQLLTSEGGFHMDLQDLHFYEEGGVGGTIEGESVTMGSAYFMRKHNVTLPRGLKLKTGVFLAVDGQLIAIFAIKYQASRNVEWALQAIRRSRIQPVLAVRGGNITPGLLRRKFNLDVKPVYPDVSTRLALSDLSDETAEKPGAIIYREGLMPFAEAVIGSRRLMSAVRSSTILCYIGAAAGMLLSYYMTHAGNFAALSPLRMLIFLLLWLVPALLLSGLVKYF